MHVLWESWPDIAGGVCQLEAGDNGTPHYQGYANFTRAKRLAAVKKLLARAHWEVARGDAASNILYCSKEEGRLAGPWRLGIIVEQGERTDWARLKDDLDEGHSQLQISDNHFRLWINHRSGIEAYQRLHEQANKKDYVTELHVICGTAGTGKSHLAHQLANDGGSTFEHDGGKWWCDYAGHRVVVMDEFRGTIPFRLLLKLADKYPCSLETKGGKVEWRAKALFITSNVRPELWYKDLDMTPLWRRFTTFTWLEGYYDFDLCKPVLREELCVFQKGQYNKDW